MDTNKFYYLKRSAEKHDARFLRCNGVIYEVKKMYYPLRYSPVLDFEEVHPVDIPDFFPEEQFDDTK